MRRQAGALAALILVATFPMGAQSAATDPGDVTGDPIVGAVTWTGLKNLSRGVLLLPGATLTIHNATVLFQTTNETHFGINVQPGARLVVRDSQFMNAKTWLPDLKNAEAYWDFHVEGVVDIERALIKHASDINFERDGVVGSRIVDTELAWLSRGIHVLRTNLTDHDEWDLVLRNVSMRDFPNVGGGNLELGGALGVLNGNVLAERLRIERAKSAGIFVDRSAVARDTGAFGNRFEGRDIVVVGGSPEGVEPGEGKLMEVRTLGDFLCDGCTFISSQASYLLFSDGRSVVLRNSTIVNGAVSVAMARQYDLRFESVRFHGAHSYVHYRYTNQGTPTWQDVSFDEGTRRAVHMEGSYPVDMRGIWWGDASGPRDDNPDDASTPTTNPGAGRRVEGPLDYRGWLTAPPATAGALRVLVGAAPALTRPGSTVSVPFEVVNDGAADARVGLRAIGPMDAVVAPASALVPAGGSVTGTLTYTLASTVAPGTSLHEAVLVDGPAGHATAAISTVASVTVPTVGIDAPAPYSTYVGPIDLRGGVVEPPALVGSGAAAASGSASAELSSLDADGDRIDDRLQAAPGYYSVVVTHDGASAAGIRGVVAAAGGRVVREFTLLDASWVGVPSDALAALASVDGVRGVWWDEPLQEQLTLGVRAVRARTSEEGVLRHGLPVDAPYAGVWSGDAHHGHSGTVGRGVLMAVIDTGIDPTHVAIDDLDDDATTVDPKIAGRISTFAILAAGDAQIAPSSLVTPGDHGTWVAGAAAGTGQGYLGDPDAPTHVSTPEDLWLHQGAAPGARVLDVDAFESVRSPVGGVGPVGVQPSAGFGLALEGFEAIANWNTQHPEDRVRVAQISLAVGTTAASHPLNAAADALADTGVLIVVAVGNNHEGAVVPATADKVLAVGALDTVGDVDRRNDFRARFSDVSNDDQQAAGVFKPELMAPGYDLFMPAIGTLDGYGDQGVHGTSFAAPIVSGVAALVFEANPALHAAQVKEILIRASEPRGVAFGQLYTDVNLDFEDDVADGGWDARWGYGYVDAEEAVRLARVTTPRTPPAGPQLTLHATESGLQAGAPSDTGVVLSPATWSHVPPSELRMGDADVHTDDRALLVVVAPSADPEPSVGDALVELRVDGVVAARTEFHDPGIRLASTPADTRIPIVLGKHITYNESGATAGHLRVVSDLGVLADDGALVVPAGSTLELSVSFLHPGEVPVAMVTGPAGTRLTTPIDPSTLPNTGGPTAVSGIRATWSATRVALSWGPAGDDRGIAAYEVLRDGLLVGTVSGSAFSFEDTAPLPVATHAYNVRAVDLHGSRGPLADPLQVALPSPTGRSIVTDVAGVVARATDLSGDGSFSTWSARLEPAALGRHAARATLFIDGEPVSSRSVVVTLAPPANQPPLVDVAAILDVVRGQRALPVSVSDPDGADDIARVEARIDGGAWSPVGDAVAVDAGALADGAHALEVRATDHSGATGSRTIAFDSAAWSAALDVPRVLLEATRTPVRAEVAGPGAEAAQPLLHLDGVGSGAVPLALAADGWRGELPALPSGALRLELRSGLDQLAATQVVVDRPPDAVIRGPATATRLVPVTLFDASADDGGIVARTWTLPNGSTATTPTLAIPAGALGVGWHTFRLDVTNVNGLAATALFAIEVVDLAPVVTIAPMQVLGAPVANAFAGERVRVQIDITDPEGDPVVVTGGVEVDGVVVPLAPGANDLEVRPMGTGFVRVALDASDPWLSTPGVAALPVLENHAPVSRLVASSLVRAGVPARVDASASFDPDRSYLNHTLEVVGLGAMHAARADLALPMGSWTLRHTLRDSSGVETVVERVITSDAWIQVDLAATQSMTLTREGRVAGAVRWHDGLPVAGANVTLFVSYEGVGTATRRTIEATTDANGAFEAALGHDLWGYNLPGAHVVTALATAPSRPDAPVQETESASRTLRMEA